MIKKRSKYWIPTLILMGFFAFLLVIFAVLLLKKETAPANVPIVEDVEAVQEEKGSFRILVGGTDRTSGLCDVLMLVSLDRDTGEVWIVQLPRDTYAGYTNGSYRKLNGAPAALGGMAEIRDFLADALGITIDRYVRLSPDALVEAVDALGGVELTLEKALNYDDPTQGLSIHLPAGQQTLDGKAAEQFVRYRSGYVRGDLGRMDAQKIFLSALMSRVRSVDSPLILGKMALSLLDDVETDLGVAELLSLVRDALSIESQNVFFVTAPGADAVGEKSGASYYVLSRDGMAELLREHLGAEDGSFDRQGVFLHPDSKRFRAIYEGYSPYLIYSASEIAENGIRIAQKR